MLDAVIMENHKIPASAVLTEPFVSSGKAMALTQGLVDYPFVVIPHPIAATEKSVLIERANTAFEDVLQILLK